MSSLLIWLAVFVISLAALVKASDHFTASAEKIGIYLHVPAFIVGLTIVALGTSLPELVSSVFAVLENSSEIVVGNVVGSNIANIFLVLGAAAVLSSRFKSSHVLSPVDSVLLLGSALLFAVAIIDGVFTLNDAILCLMGLVLFLYHSISSAKKHRDVQLDKEIVEQARKVKIDWKFILFFLISAFFIYLGAKYTIQSLINLSEILNIGSEIIAASAVALGTSLPELVVSVSAAKKGNADIAIGNVWGSNIFNIFAVMGIPGLIGVLVIPQGIINFGLPMMLLATLMFLFIVHDNRITKTKGYTLLIFYLLFVAGLFM